MKTNPLISIGVTTYDRDEMLKECLLSILNQTFCDVEILVGNDCVTRSVTGESLGIDDPRIIFFNYEKNIGPVENANTLLRLSTGEYFTLLADDDLHGNQFLSAMAKCISIFNSPQSIFSSFSSDLNEIMGVGKTDDIVGGAKSYCGSDFLKLYLERKVKTIGCYSVTNTNHLRAIGGLSQLGHGRSIYAEMPIVLASGLLDNVIYLDCPLVYFRPHEGSLSSSNIKIEDMRTSQVALLDRSLPILRDPIVLKDFPRNLYLLLVWCVKDYATVINRSGNLNLKSIYQYLKFLRVAVLLAKHTPYARKIICSIAAIAFSEIVLATKAKIKRLIWPLLKNP
jgi:glycosyltransferase involved in cell wall biosynthesis